MASNFAFKDMFSNKAFDVNQAFSSSRRDIEAFTAAGNVVAENTQAIARRQAEVARENFDSSLKASKDMMNGGSPDVSKNAELAKSFFENALSNMRELTEMATKSAFEAFDILNKRAAEKMEEFTSKSSASSAAPSSKKKA
jgi:phasin family protein